MFVAKTAVFSTWISHVVTFLRWFSTTWYTNVSLSDLLNSIQQLYTYTNWPQKFFCCVTTTQLRILQCKHVNSMNIATFNWSAILRIALTWLRATFFYFQQWNRSFFGRCCECLTRRSDELNWKRLCSIFFVMVCTNAQVYWLRWWMVQKVIVVSFSSVILQ